MWNVPRPVSSDIKQNFLNGFKLVPEKGQTYLKDIAYVIIL